MTKRQFLNAVSNGGGDVLQAFLDLLAESGTRYCVIGGLAVNAYVEPVVSLDLDVVVAASDTEAVIAGAEKRGFKLERFEHSINLNSRNSDLRIQVQTDSRYQDFPARAEPADVLGYTMNVAALEDVLQGKVWAASDPARRRSKRQKDLADIARLIEAYPELELRVPDPLRERLR